MAAWDELFGLLPKTEIPASIRYFVVIMIVFHILAVIMWAIFAGREIAKGPRKFKPS